MYEWIFVTLMKSLYKAPSNPTLNKVGKGRTLKDSKKEPYPPLAEFVSSKGKKEILLSLLCTKCFVPSIVFDTVLMIIEVFQVKILQS